MKSKFRFLSLLSRRGNDKHASGPRLLARLLRDEEGSYLLIVALALPVFIGLAGLATEGALIFYNHRTVSSAADAASYSAAISYSLDASLPNAQTEAEAIVTKYGFVVGTGNDQANVVATVDTTTYSPLTAIDVAITRPQLSILSSLFVSGFSVRGSAKTIISGGALGGGGSGGCILSLASSGTGIALGGTASITNSDSTCGIFANSSIALNGTGTITAGAVSAAGTVSVGGSSNIGPPPQGYTQNSGTQLNPYANITMPSAASGACVDAPDSTPPGKYWGTGNTRLTYTVPAGNYCSNINIKNANITLNPGTFAGNINIDTNSSVTLNPGIYVLNGPVQLSVVSGSSLSGVGVTLVFTDPSGAAYPHGQGTGNSPVALDISSGANVNLLAPTSGATNGMLIMGNSNIPLDTVFNLQANATAGSCDATNCIGGVIYVPTGDFTWQGGPILNGGCTQMISYRITLQGSASFVNTNCDLSGGGAGGSGGGAKLIGNIVTLVK